MFGTIDSGTVSAKRSRLFRITGNGINVTPDIWRAIGHGIGVEIFVYLSGVTHSFLNQAI
jgi:hypothetical protein